MQLDIRSIFKPLFAGLLTIGISISAGSAHASYSQMYVFGDSISDTGLFKQLTGYPTAPFFSNGRFSNGPVAVEYVADRLGLTLTAGVNNFAVGGAYSGYGNNIVWPTLTHTGMLDQFNAYKNALGSGGADPNALYFLWGGSNNMNACNWFTCTQQQVYAAADNITAIISGLSTLGAKHFFVSNLYALPPMATTFNNHLADDVNALIASGVDIEYFDSHAVMLQMQDPNNPWGFTVVNAPCYQGNLAVQGSVCANPDAYVWGYNGHLTAAANRVIGEAMADTFSRSVPEPQTIALVLLALCSATWTRRRSKR